MLKVIAHLIPPPYDGGVLESALLRELLDYWRAKRAGGRLPSRADVDPAELKALLPHLYLLEVEPAPRRFRHRLIGTKVARWSGRDVTGRYAGDGACGDAGRVLLELYERVADAAQPLFTPWQPSILGSSAMQFSRLLLPLSTDGRRIDMILGGADEKPD